MRPPRLAPLIPMLLLALVAAAHGQTFPTLENVRVQKDLVYGAVGDKPLMLDVYQPVNAPKTNAPVILRIGPMREAPSGAALDLLAENFTLVYAGYMPEGAARAYLRDLPDAELHLLDGGHQDDRVEVERPMIEALSSPRVSVEVSGVGEGVCAIATAQSAQTRARSVKASLSILVTGCSPPKKFDEGGVRLFMSGSVANVMRLSHSKF